MLLLLLDSLLLIFITFSLGGIAKRALSRLLGIQLITTFIEDYLLGLMVSAVYFNLLSFLVPVNYLVLIPLLLISIWHSKKSGLSLKEIAKWRSKYFTNKSERLILFLVLATIGIYFIMPPINMDSVGYHYHTVYWYENYKIIPGLGNVHGRLAFNAVTFILSAPYAFSHIAGQSLYPFNAVLISVFYLWLLQQMIERKNYWSSIIYLVAGILLLRPMIPNIASPSSEPLVIITVSVVFLRLIELIRHNKQADPAFLTLPVLISFFALTAKLTSLPLLLVPAVWVVFFMRRQKKSFYIKIAVVVILVIVPWMARNVLLSGYLFYPLFQVDLFNVDWKVPRDVAIYDYGLGTLGCKGNDIAVWNLNTISEWFPYWIERYLTQRKIIDFATIILSVLASVSWIFLLYKKKLDKRLFLLWLCAFAAVVLWFIQSPEFRFAAGFLIAIFCLPLLNVTDRLALKPFLFRVISVVVLFFAFSYFSVRAVFLHPRFHTNGIEKLWLMPLKDKLYYTPFDMRTARYENLGHGVKLYYEDSAHNCIHIYDQPCILWDYGKIELRGNKITDGFKNVRNDMRKNFPLMFVRKW
jgi:hypothetical protein